MAVTVIFGIAKFKWLPFDIVPIGLHGNPDLIKLTEWDELLSEYLRGLSTQNKYLEVMLLLKKKNKKNPRFLKSVNIMGKN